jgi:hypothetical protein
MDSVSLSDNLFACYPHELRPSFTVGNVEKHSGWALVIRRDLKRIRLHRGEGPADWGTMTILSGPGVRGQLRPMPTIANGRIHETCGLTIKHKNNAANFRNAQFTSIKGFRERPPLELYSRLSCNVEEDVRRKHGLSRQGLLGASERCEA